MKMPEKHDLLPPFSRQRNKASGAILRLQNWRTFAADIMAAFTKTVIDGNDVRHYRLRFVTFDFAAGSNLAYITSVFIGYIGTDSIGSLNKRFAKKPE